MGTNGLSMPQIALLPLEAFLFAFSTNEAAKTQSRTHRSLLRHVAPARDPLLAHVPEVKILLGRLRENFGPRLLICDSAVTNCGSNPSSDVPVTDRWRRSMQG